jgi:hypothetical protein
MDRKEFLQKSFQYGFSCCALMALESTSTPLSAEESVEEQLKQVQQQKKFIENWLDDLVDTMEKVLDEPTRIKLMAGTGQGCHRRHKFTQDIVDAGKGDLDKLIEAYKKSFGIKKEGDLVHISYGRGPKGCWCPAANDRPAKPHDMHCECTRAKHQHIFETALGRPFKVEIVSSIRRGGENCHFIVHLT